MKQLTITLNVKQSHPGKLRIKEQMLIESTRNCIKDTLLKLTDVDEIEIVSSSKHPDVKVDAIVYFRESDGIYGLSYVLIEACPDPKIDRFVFHGGFGPVFKEHYFFSECIRIANQIYELLHQEGFLLN